MTKLKCECGKQQAFYLLDSWDKEDPPRKLCVVCVDKMIMHIGRHIIKDVLNLREISNQEKPKYKGAKINGGNVK